MDVNEGNHDDTLGSPDDTGFTRTVTEGHDVGTVVESTNNVVDSSEYDPDEWTKPPIRDEKTGRFLPGTGVSKKGGRPVGAKDKISRKLVDLCTDLVADKGSEMLDHLSRTDPAAAMAICLKVVPPEEMRRVFNDDMDTTKDALNQITINLVSKPTEQRIEAPVSRITHADIPLDSVIEQAAEEAAVKPVQEPPEPTQEQLDREAERVEVERVARRNDTVKAHGGLTGRPKRRDPGSTLDYPDEPVI